MFDHVQIKVKDFKSSRVFYETVLATLGYAVVLEFKNVVGIGIDPHNMFEVGQALEDSPLSASVHLAFVADSEESVRRFHEVALSLGAKDNGAPGLRPEYEEGYFAAFVIDPDGHNLEAVYKLS